MKCQDVKKKLNAWMDNERPNEKNFEINQNIEKCPTYAQQADELRKLLINLNNMPTLQVPVRLARKPCENLGRISNIPA